MMLMEDLREIVTELEQESQMAPVNIELVDNELAVVFMNSKKAEVRKLRSCSSLIAGKIVTSILV